jgi:hypothetical protein
MLSADATGNFSSPLAEPAMFFAVVPPQANRIVSKILYHNHPAAQEISRLVLSPKAHYCVLNSQPLVPVLSHWTVFKPYLQGPF